MRCFVRATESGVLTRDGSRASIFRTTFGLHWWNTNFANLGSLPAASMLSRVGELACPVSSMVKSLSLSDLAFFVLVLDPSHFVIPCMC